MARPRHRQRGSTRAPTRPWAPLVGLPVLLAIVLLAAVPVAAQAPSLTYQGELLVDGVAFDGSLDLQLALFDAIGAEDKRMIVYPGGHDDTPDEGLRFAREFLAGELRR